MKATPEGMSAHVWYYFIWSTSSLSAHIWSASQLVYRSFVLTCKCPSLSPCTFCLTCSFTSCCLLFSHICMHAATLTHQHSSGQGVRCTCNCSFWEQCVRCMRNCAFGKFNLTHIDRVHALTHTAVLLLSY